MRLALPVSAGHPDARGHLRLVHIERTNALKDRLRRSSPIDGVARKSL